MERVKIYLDEALNGYVACGICGKSKEMSFSGREAPHGSLIKCSCGNTFIVTFERRQNYRKRLDTFGVCFVEAAPNEGMPIRMIDVSLGGLQFKESGGAAFQLNQILRVVFRLDGKFVNLIASVRNISGENIGAKILTMDEHSKKIIGFYLLP